jgi:hypothetical protein
VVEFANAQPQEAAVASQSAAISNGKVADLMPSTGYFQAVSHLNQLRAQVSQKWGASAYDLIKQLDAEAQKAGFEPVGANCRGITVDDFFKTNAEFIQLEEQLAKKLVPENVSEVFELIKDANYYKPTCQIVKVIETIYLERLEQAQRSASF